MEHPLANLKLLREDMRSKGWIVDVFNFTYKKQDYFVIVELYQEGEHKPEYTLCKLKFIQKDDQDHQLLVPANVNGLKINARELREYFRIDYKKNVGDLLSQFYQYLGRFIPSECLSNKSDEEVKILVDSLSRSDSEDPLKQHCYKLKRNPKRLDGTPGQRSQFNDNKTRLLRPELYRIVCKDKSISFCYTSDATLERTDAEILEAFSR